MESLGPIGVKLVFGEANTSIPNLPMKARCAVAIPWHIVRNLIEGLSKAEVSALGLTPANGQSSVE